MAQQLINVGAAPDDGTGDTGRDGGIKINANFTELYQFDTNHLAAADPHTGYLLADGSRDSSGGQLFTGHVGIGGTATVDANYVLNIKETVTDTSVLKTSLDFAIPFSGAPFVGGSIVSFKGTTSYETTPTIPTGSATGLLFGAQQNSTSALANLIGAAFTTGVVSAAGAVTNQLGVDVRATLPAVSGAITDAIGVQIQNYGYLNTVKATGLKITKQTAATAVNSFGIVLNGDDLGSDIAFGAAQDVRQHFNGTELEFQGAGIAHVATPVVHNGYVTIAINGVAHKFMTGV